MTGCWEEGKKKRRREYDYAELIRRIHSLRSEKYRGGQLEI
jgi:hypothetical protein